MSWTFTKDLPIYTQMVDIIETKIVSGEYKRGEKLLSIRELASEVGVNPNTVQKVMAELERKGLITTNRSSGKFITEDEALIKCRKLSQAERAAEDYYTKVKDMGYCPEDAKKLLENAIKNSEKGIGK